MVRVVVADDHPLFLGGIVRAIEDADDLDLVAIATDGAGALAAIVEHAPDVALLDMRLPELTGLQVLERLDCDATSRALERTASLPGARSPSRAGLIDARFGG